MASPIVLLRAAHLGPTVAVTAVTGLLAVAAHLPATTVAILVTAVFAGQLVIGWSNDLLDAGRDRQVGRSDKPLATGALTSRTVAAALGTAAVAAVAVSLPLGWRSAAVHLLVVVGSGLAYNLGLKATAWSWLPYATAFGTLPAVVTLAADPPRAPLWWVVAASASLGVAAHFLNALPDLAEDAATGIRGLPHRIGGRAAQVVATALLVAASLAAVVGPAGPPPVWAWLVLLVVAGLAVVTLTAHGHLPFRAAVAIALADVTLLALGR